jgi:hypothetical protein
MKEFSIVCTESLGHTKTIHEAIVDLTVRPTAVCDGTWQLKGRWGVDATGRVHVHADFVGRAGQIFANSCGCIGSRSNVERNLSTQTAVTAGPPLLGHGKSKKQFPFNESSPSRKTHPPISSPMA